MTRFVAVVVVCLAEVALAAPAPPVGDILSHLEASAKSVHSLDAEFVQKNKVKLFKEELTSKGRVQFTPPRHLVWQYTSPDPSTLTVDGNRATLSQPGAPERTFDLEHDATMRAVFDQLLAWLGPGSLAQLEGGYQLTSTGTAAQPALVMTPRPGTPMEKAFQRIELRLDGKSWLVTGISLVEKNGDEKVITFTRMTRR